MKQYKVIYVGTRPGLAEDLLEKELNDYAKKGWSLHSHSQPEFATITAILERDIPDKETEL